MLILRLPFPIIPAAALSILAWFATPVKADYIINFVEVGNDVIATGSGSLNTTGLTLMPLSGFGTSAIGPASGSIFGDIGTIPTRVDGYFGGISGPTSFGTGIEAAASSSSSSIFGFSATGFGVVSEPLLAVSEGYISGTAISYQATWLNQTLFSLGVNPGTYSWTWGTGGNADFLTLNFVGAVPEPSSFMLVGLGLVYSFKRRR